VPRWISRSKFLRPRITRFCHRDVEGKPILPRKLVDNLKEPVARVRRALRLRRSMRC
jgi:hypothetical protein